MDDRQLWRELTRGSERALETLMFLHINGLMHYGYKFVKDEEFLKDSVQEMFVALWHRRDTLTEPESVKAYLCVCLKRRIFRNARKFRLFSFDTTAFSGSFGEHEFEFSPEWWLISEEDLAEKTKEVTRLLNALPRRQREVMYLKYYQGLNRDEIASVMSIAPQTVSNLMQMALSFLRQKARPEMLGILFLMGE